MAIDIGRTWLRLLAALARRNHRDRAHLPRGEAKLLGVTRHIGQRPGRRPGQTPQQQQRRRKLVRLARQQDKVDEPARGVADTDDLAAKTAPRTSQSLRVAGSVAIESQTQFGGLLARAPAAFWCARATVPSMQAKASFGSPSATTCAMIRSHTPLTVQRRKRR